ncbi:6-bladed beta-propeller [Alistipes onderdonkii]|mgnify:FL=1|uniref:6-bladed beta-propeller n=1 Tax=Alistipes onderdonkii TaxID=328813 RepID=UPI0018AB2D8B|nr:6-bladed beta-propeller [Alistipes onderdonkii]
MNRISVIISASIIIICLISCDSTQSADRIDESRTTTIKIATNNGTPDLDSIVRNHKFTRLETSEECLVGEVYKLSCRNEKYYILDRHLQKALFVFDEEGKFRNRIGRRGRGPGEFIEPTDFIVSDSSVTVFDMFGHKLLYYNPDGTFIRSVRLPYSIYEIESGRDGSVIYAVGGDNSKCDSLKNYELLEIGPEGDIRAKVYKNKYSMDFSNKYDLQGFDEDVIYKKAFRPAVYMLRDKNLYAKYIFDIPSHALPGDYEKLCRGNFERFIKQYRDEYTYFNGQFWETDRYAGIGITAKRMPYLVVYDKDTHRTVSGLVGITFGGNETDRNGLFATVMNGPVDVAGNRITGVLNQTRLSPGMQAALFGQREETGYANPVIVTLDLMP